MSSSLGFTLHVCVHCKNVPDNEVQSASWNSTSAYFYYDLWRSFNSYFSLWLVWGIVTLTTTLKSTVHGGHILHLAEITEISPRFLEISLWCLWVFKTRRDRWDLAMIFVGFSNLVEFAARFSTSRRDWRDLAVKFDSFCILPRFWKTQTSYWDCQNITQQEA